MFAIANIQTPMLMLCGKLFKEPCNTTRYEFYLSKSEVATGDSTFRKIKSKTQTYEIKTCACELLEIKTRVRLGGRFTTPIIRVANLWVCKLC